MFELQIKELYKYLTNKVLEDTFSIIRQERKNTRELRKNYGNRCFGQKVIVY